MTQLRIGLFGGAFDPPHDVHVALARAAIDELKLDRLHVVPTGDAWHKARSLSPGADRLAMCRLAFACVPGVVVDDRELRRGGPTYTIDTLGELQSEYPGAALFVQIGADQAAAFHTWRRASDILQMAFVSIAVREDVAKEKSRLDLRDPLPGLRCDPQRLRVLALPAMAHSATDVRRRIAEGLSVRHLVAPAVAGYIAEHHLYQAPA